MKVFLRLAAPLEPIGVAERHDGRPEAADVDVGVGVGVGVVVGAVEAGPAGKAPAAGVVLALNGVDGTLNLLLDLQVNRKMILLQPRLLGLLRLFVTLLIKACPNNPKCTKEMLQK